jgi:hypothetical protein
MSSVVTGLSECLNCGEPLGGTFCSACGQKATSPDPTFHDFFHELTHELLHVDGRVFQSIRFLFTRPGVLTREYCLGRRASYIAPMRLYLIFSVLYFVLAVYAPIELDAGVDAKRGRVLQTGGVTISGDVLDGRSDAEVARWVRNLQHEWMPRVMFLMVPAFAGLIMLTARRQRRHFPQHLYFAIHTHAAWFGILSVAMALRFVPVPGVNEAASILTLVGILGYTTMAVGQVYGTGVMRSLWRSLSTLAAYMVLLIALTLTIFFVTYLAENRADKKEGASGNAPSVTSAPAAAGH